jgi:hypothetical protein
MPTPDEILEQRLALVLRNVSDLHAGDPVAVVEEALRGEFAGQYPLHDMPSDARIRKFAQLISQTQAGIGECPDCHKRVPLTVTGRLLREHTLPGQPGINCPTAGHPPAGASVPPTPPPPDR